MKEFNYKKVFLEILSNISDEHYYEREMMELIVKSISDKKFNGYSQIIGENFSSEYFKTKKRLFSLWITNFSVSPKVFNEKNMEDYSKKLFFNMSNVTDLTFKIFEELLKKYQIHLKFNYEKSKVQ
jgi:hypothetical protein